MFRLNGGQYCEDNRTKDIIITTNSFNKPYELAVGLGIITTGILAGVGYIAATAYRNGAESFLKTALKTQRDLGWLDWSEKSINNLTVKWVKPKFTSKKD